MKTIDFNKNDFPLTTNVLGYMQEAVQLIEKITGILTGNYILSGCQLVGGSLSSGYVVVGGEIMQFTGGIAQNYVRVVTTNETVTVADGTYTKTVKFLILGTGTGQILWSTFRRASDVIEGGPEFKKKVINIGPWDMNNTAQMLVDHGLISTVALTDIRGVQVLVITDNTFKLHDLSTAGSWELMAEEIMLRRNASGIFDTSNFQDTSVNRGYIIIDYI